MAEVSNNNVVAVDAGQKKARGGGVWFDPRPATVRAKPWWPYILNLTHPQQLFFIALFIYEAAANNQHWACAIFLIAHVILCAIVDGYAQNKKAASYKIMDLDSRTGSLGKLSFTTALGWFNILIYAASMVLMLAFALYQLAVIKNPLCASKDNAYHDDPRCLGSLGLARNSFGFIFVAYGLPILSFPCLNILVSKAREILFERGMFARQNDAIMALGSVNTVVVVGERNDFKNVFGNQYSDYDGEEESAQLSPVVGDVRFFANNRDGFKEAEDAISSAKADGKTVAIMTRVSADAQWSLPDEVRTSADLSIYSTDKVANVPGFLDAIEAKEGSALIPYIVVEDSLENRFGECVTAARTASFRFKNYALFRTATMFSVLFFFVVAILIMPAPKSYYSNSAIKSFLDTDSSDAKIFTGALQFFEIDPTGIMMMAIANVFLTTMLVLRSPAKLDYSSAAKQFKWLPVFVQGCVWGLVLCAFAVIFYVLCIWAFAGNQFGEFLYLYMDGETAEPLYTKSVGALSIIMLTTLGTLNIGAYMLMNSRCMFVNDVMNRICALCSRNCDNKSDENQYSVCVMVEEKYL